MLYQKMSTGEADEAIEILDDFRLTNDLFREHLLDLCMNKRAREAFENLSTQQKSAFTRAYNRDHKDPTLGKKGAKKSTNVGQQDDFDSGADSDDEKEQ